MTTTGTVAVLRADHGNGSVMRMFLFHDASGRGNQEQGYSD